MITLTYGFLSLFLKFISQLGLPLPFFFCFKYVRVYTSFQGMGLYLLSCICFLFQLVKEKSSWEGHSIVIKIEIQSRKPFWSIILSQLNLMGNWKHRVECELAQCCHLSSKSIIFPTLTFLGILFLSRFQHDDSS